VLDEEEEVSVLDEEEEVSVLDEEEEVSVLDEEEEVSVLDEEEEVIVLDEEEEVSVLDEEEEVSVLDEEEDTDDNIVVVEQQEQEQAQEQEQEDSVEQLVARLAAAAEAAMVQQDEDQVLQQLQHSEAEALWQFETEFVIKESASTNVDCMICYSSNAAFVPQGCDHTESRGCESCLSRLRQCPFCREPFSALVNVITEEVVALSPRVPHGSPGEGDEASGNNLHQEAEDQTSAFDSAVKCTECDGLDHENAGGEDTEFMLLCDAITQERGQDGRWKPCVLNGQYVPCPRGTHIRCCAPRPWPIEQVRCREDATSAGDWFCEQCREDHEEENYPLVAAHHLPAEPGRPS
jgi:hypothetical protein